jgi:DNA/RNA-binding domain of Phe-tRNA-synthetase-like protein
VNAPFVDHQLAGWELAWAGLELADVGGGEITALRELRQRTAERARARLTLELLAQQPAVSALRALFRAAGCDPTRYRPSSEALLRRMLKGEDLPAIHPLVDVNNVVSIELAVPCCILAEGSVRPPFILRAGCEGEAFASLRGPFQLSGKPLLADGAGPFGTPITDSERVKVTATTRRAWMVAYLPKGVISGAQVAASLGSTVAGLAEVRIFPLDGRAG